MRAAAKRPWTSFQLRSFVGAMALVIGAWTSADAQASCGDYLHVGEGPQSQTADGQKPLSPAEIPSPCSGPNCRRDLPLPAQPAPIPSSPDTDKLAVRNCSKQNCPAHHVQVLDLCDEVPLSGHPFGVKRPPRV